MRIRAGELMRGMVQGESLSRQQKGQEGGWLWGSEQSSVL